MHPATIASVFAVVLVGELPDKTFIANLVMASRHRAWPVFTGSAVAFEVHVVIAVAAGSVVTLLPRRPVEIAVAVLFAVGAVVLLFGSEKVQVEEGEIEAGRLDTALPSARRIAVTTFGIIFVGEWGDLTQILIANFSARYRQPLSVGIGASAGLLVALALAVGSGRALLRVLPLSVIRRISGVVLAGFALWSAIEAAR